MDWSGPGEDSSASSPTAWVVYIAFCWWVNKWSTCLPAPDCINGQWGCTYIGAEQWGMEWTEVVRREMYLIRFIWAFQGADEVSWYKRYGCNGKGLARTQWYNMLGSHING